MGIIGRFLGCIIAMPIAAWLLPGVHTVNSEAAWLAGLMLGIIYLVLRPFVKFVLAPFNCLTLGLLGFFVDVAFIQLAAGEVAGFRVDNMLWAVAASLIVSICRETLGSFAKKKR